MLPTVMILVFLVESALLVKFFSKKGESFATFLNFVKQRHTTTWHGPMSTKGMIERFEEAGKLRLERLYKPVMKMVVHVIKTTIVQEEALPHTYSTSRDFSSSFVWKML